MAKLTHVIPESGFETVRKQIATILKDELTEQANLDSDFEAPEIYLSRLIPVNQVKLPAVNIKMSRGNIENEDPKSEDGIYTYQIECFTKGKSSNTASSSEISEKDLHKLMGKVRGILRHPTYYELDLQPPALNNAYFDNFEIGDSIEKQNFHAISQGRWEFTVEISEKAIFEEPGLIAQNTTQVYLGESEDGYKWIWKK